jgi:hypothetical protein
MKKNIVIRALRFGYFNIFKKIFFIDYLTQNIFRRLSIFLNRGITLIIRPEFEHVSDFLDYYYRINWYFKPIENRIKNIYFTIKNDTIEYNLPSYFNSQINEHLISKNKILFNTKVKKSFLHNRYNFIFLDCKADDKKLSFEKNVVNINSRDQGTGSVNSLKFAAKNFDNNQFLRNSKKNLQLLKESTDSDRVLLIGSGPNSQQLLEKDISFSDVMVCNSVIKNSKFMKKYKPKYVVFGDPTWHSGPSRYVQEFKKTLAQTIDEYNSTIITVERDAHIIKEYMPESYHKNFIFIPIVKTNKKTNLNYNFNKNFFVAGTNNILTLLMLPVSFYLYKDIFFAGFDGNPDKKKTYYWKHNPSLQFGNEFTSQEQTHPYIFDREKEDYGFIYESHLEKLSQWLSDENTENHNLKNLTDSHMQPFIRIS